MGSGSPPGSANPTAVEYGVPPPVPQPRAGRRPGVVLRELDQAGRAAGHLGLRGRLRLLRELPKREGRVPQAGSAASCSVRSERLEGAVCEQRACGFGLGAELVLADEVRVVGVREPVGVRHAARRRAHAPRARGRSLRRRTPRGTPRSHPALRVRGEWDSRSTTPHAHVGRGRHAADRRSSRVERRSHLEVRSRAAQQARAEETRPGGRRSGNMVERPHLWPGGRSGGGPSRSSTPASVRTAIA